MSKLIKIGTNSKLGEKVRMGSFNLPAKITCPGASDRCKAICYADKFRWKYPNVIKSVVNAHKASQKKGFVIDVIGEVKDKVPLVRLHSSGDFYSPMYVRQWTKIAKACPDTQFCAYTRSWTDKKFLPSLKALSVLPNFQLFLSVDKSMRQTLPKGYRVAYCNTEWERPTNSFRCPNQVSNKKPTCQKCKLCFRPAGLYDCVEFKEH